MTLEEFKQKLLQIKIPQNYGISNQQYNPNEYRKKLARRVREALLDLDE